MLAGIFGSARCARHRGAARPVGVARPQPRHLGAAYADEHSEELVGMDEHFGGARFVAAPHVGFRSGGLDSRRNRAHVPGLDEEHVERIPALAMKPAHRKVLARGLGDFDSVEPRRRIEHREGALIAEVLALDWNELRLVEREDPLIAIRSRPPILHDVRHFVDPLYEPDRGALVLRAQNHAHPEGCGGIDEQLSGCTPEGHALRFEMTRGNVEILDREPDAEEPLPPSVEEFPDRAGSACRPDHLDEAGSRLHRGANRAYRLRFVVAHRFGAEQCRGRFLGGIEAFNRNLNAIHPLEHRRQPRFERYLLEGRLVAFGLNDGRAMMKDHEPSVSHALEGVGAEHLGADDAVVTALGEIFLDDHDGKIAAYYHFQVAEFEFHLEGAFEDALPARHHRTPSQELAPSGMDADDALILKPHGLHPGDIEALKRLVKGAIGGHYCITIVHRGTQAFQPIDCRVLPPEVRTTLPFPRAAQPARRPRRDEPMRPGRFRLSSRQPRRSGLRQGGYSKSRCDPARAI